MSKNNDLLEIDIYHQGAVITKVKISPSATVETLKKSIHSLTKIPEDNQQLIADTMLGPGIVPLDNNKKTLQDYGRFMSKPLKLALVTPKPDAVGKPSDNKKQDDSSLTMTR